MTSRTTAHLTNAIDDRYYEIDRRHGEDGARMAPLEAAENPSPGDARNYRQRARRPPTHPPGP